MTEFEQQVAKILRLEILKVRELHGPEAPIAIAFALAPRVAAAIDADRFGEADEIARQRGRALAALRGGA